MTKDMISQLIEKLQAADEATRLRAAERLGALGDQAAKAVPALVATQTDGSDRVAIAANNAIRRIGAAGIPYLLRMIRDPLAHEFRDDAAAFHDEDEFRSYAADSLADIGPSALPQLLKLIEDEDPIVREVAIEAIPRVGVAAEQALPKLAKALRDPRWAEAVAASIARIARHAAKPEEAGAFKVLLSAAKDSDVTLRRTAVSALEFMGERATAALPVLTEARQDPDQQVREAAEALIERLTEKEKQREEKGDIQK
ncbi:MAG: HEAT repeat domain-containing protein [Gemmataceae bacterium]|nr:HEAT repeat domain-containing protein [Gemmataceae bacterium]